jgi:hypothetical protein
MTIDAVAPGRIAGFDLTAWCGSGTLKGAESLRNTSILGETGAREELGR